MKKIQDGKRYAVIATCPFSTREKGNLIIAQPNQKLNLLGSTVKRLLWHGYVEFPKAEKQELDNG